MTHHRSIRVVKIGGSLLRLDDLKARLEVWFGNQQNQVTAVIVGGGKLVDCMREHDRRFVLDQSAMHWRCVRLLRHSFEILAELMPMWQSISSEKQLQDWIEQPQSRTALIAVDVFYNESKPSIAQLPVGWETTTDSIAAELALQIESRELVLMKSRPQPEFMTWLEASQIGIVDEAFPRACKGIDSISIVDLTAQG